MVIIDILGYRAFIWGSLYGIVNHSIDWVFIFFQKLQERYRPEFPYSECDHYCNLAVYFQIATTLHNGVFWKNRNICGEQLRVTV